MKVTSIKPRGQRIFKTFSYPHFFPGKSVSSNKNKKTTRPLWIETVERGFWFDSDRLEWIKDPKDFLGLHSAYYSMKHRGLPNVNSLKSAKRLIYKWKAPKGTKFKVSLPFIGFDFIVTKN